MGTDQYTFGQEGAAPSSNWLQTLGLPEEFQSFIPGSTGGYAGPPGGMSEEQFLQFLEETGNTGLGYEQHGQEEFWESYYQGNPGGIPETQGFDDYGWTSSNIYNFLTGGGETDVELQYGEGGEVIDVWDIPEYGGSINWDEEGNFQGFTGGSSLADTEAMQYYLQQWIADQSQFLTPEALRQTVSSTYDPFMNTQREAAENKILPQLEAGPRSKYGKAIGFAESGAYDRQRKDLLEKYSKYMGGTTEDIGRQMQGWQDTVGDAWGSLEDVIENLTSNEP